MADDTKHFYVTLFSNAPQSLFPENTNCSFTVELARPIDLGPNDTWEVGLCEFTYPPKFKGTINPTMIVGDTNALIYCNLISPQFVGKELIRCLRTVVIPSLPGEHYFTHIYYVTIEKRFITHIRMEVRDQAGVPFAFRTDKVPIKCVTFSSYPYVVTPLKTRHRYVISAFHDHGYSRKVLCETSWWW